jgi:hypothetical protein
MGCLTCTNLEQALESRLSKYSEARSAAFYQVSTELAAKKKVDMERARNDMEEHQLTCPSRRASTPESDPNFQRKNCGPAGLASR